jgi:hypothetical protein
MQGDPGLTFTAPRRCEHCQNYAPMRVSWTGKVADEEVDDEGFVGWYEYWDYTLLVCPACERPIITCEYSAAGYPAPETTTVFPTPDRVVRGLPRQIAQAYGSALKVKHDPNAYAVLIGRVLDLICKDRGAEGETLFKRLNHLSEKGEIPTKLVDVAHSLRHLRNIGAHADLGTLTAGEVPLLEDLCRAILEYVYSAPTLVHAAEERLRKLQPSPNVEKSE